MAWSQVPPRSASRNYLQYPSEGVSETGAWIVSSCGRHIDTISALLYHACWTLAGRDVVNHKYFMTRCREPCERAELEVRLRCLGAFTHANRNVNHGNSNHPGEREIAGLNLVRWRRLDFLRTRSVVKNTIRNGERLKGETVPG